VLPVRVGGARRALLSGVFGEPVHPFTDAPLAVYALTLARVVPVAREGLETFEGVGFMRAVPQFDVSLQHPAAGPLGPSGLDGPAGTTGGSVRPRELFLDEEEDEKDPKEDADDVPEDDDEEEDEDFEDEEAEDEEEDDTWDEADDDDEDEDEEDEDEDDDFD
jgi:hypothetical protein